MLNLRKISTTSQIDSEPTLLAMILAVVALGVLPAVCVAGILFVPAFGYIWWTFAGVAVVLAWLIFGVSPKPSAVSPTGRQRWLRRILRLTRILLIGFLTSWLGLILWSALCLSGPAPPPKADPALIRVVTWNIHCGQDEGLPWERFDWPARKHALRAALDQARPDILCVQEARPGQVAFLEEVLPGCRRAGVGRDGDAGGEHCAIYFDRHRFEMIGGKTFWLEEPIDQPRVGSALDVKRICTWVRLRDQASRRTLSIYNTHLYLTEASRRTAANIILKQVAAGDPTDAVLLTADFNASPSCASRRRFLEAGLADSAERAGKRTGKPTFHCCYGIGVTCLDGVLVDRHWLVHNHLILDVKPNNIFPSDHFAVLTDLGLE